MQNSAGPKVLRGDQAAVSAVAKGAAEPGVIDARHWASDVERGTARIFEAHFGDEGYSSGSWRMKPVLWQATGGCGDMKHAECEHPGSGGCGCTAFESN